MARRPRLQRRPLLRRARRRRPDRVGAPAAEQRDQGARRHHRARHGLRQARPRLRRPLPGAGLGRRLLPAGRSRRPRPRPQRRGPAARRGGRRHPGLLHHPGVRPARGRQPRARRVRRRGRTGVAQPRDGGDRHQARPARARRQATRRRRRAPPHQGEDVRADVAAVDVSDRTRRVGDGGPAGRAGIDARVPRDDAMPDAVPDRPPRRSRSRPRAASATTAPASRPRSTFRPTCWSPPRTF